MWFVVVATLVGVSYTAPPSCPTPQQVESYRDELGAAPWPPGVVIVVVEVPDGFVGTVSVDGMRQEFRSAQCRSVVRAAVLSVVVARDPDLLFERLEASAPAEPDLAPSPDPPPALADDRTSNHPRATPPLEGGFAVTGGVGRGLVAGVTGSLDGLVLLRVGPAHLQLGVSHWFRNSVPHPEDDRVEVSVQLTTGRVLGCWEARPLARLSIPLCGGLEVGAASGRGEGAVATSGSAVAPWVGVTARSGLWWRFAGPWALTANIEGTVGFTRPVFGVAGLDDRVVATSRGLVRGTFGLGAYFSARPAFVSPPSR